MSTIKDRVLVLIRESEDGAFLRREFSDLGSRSGVNRALRALVGQNRLIKIGYGVYAPVRNGRPAFKLSVSVIDALRKLDAEPTYGGRAWREWQEGKTTQIPAKPTVTVRKRITRALGRGNTTYRYEYEQTRQTDPEQ